MTRIDQVIVAIPARNEAERLPAALDAVRAASRYCHAPVLVVVAADACTDTTADIATAHGALVVVSDAGRVGTARALAIDAALKWSVADPEHIWIANTDADSTVPNDWLAVHLEFADRGVALLRGAVHPDTRELSAGHLRRWLTLNPPVEDHDYVYGANLGLTAAAYLASGGFRDLPLNEDVEIVRLVATAGRLTSSTARAPVHTSARPIGRVDGGFATYFRQQILKPSRL